MIVFRSKNKVIGKIRKLLKINIIHRLRTLRTSKTSLSTRVGNTQFGLVACPAVPQRQ